MTRTTALLENTPRTLSTELRGYESVSCTISSKLQQVRWPTSWQDSSYAIERLSLTRPMAPLARPGSRSYSGSLPFTSVPVLNSARPNSKEPRPTTPGTDASYQSRFTQIVLAD